MTRRGLRHGPRTLAGQFLMLQLVVLGLVLAAVAVVTVQQSTQDFRATRSTRMVAVAESLAAAPLVRDVLAEDRNPRQLDGEIARATLLSGARQVLILSAGGTVEAASDPAANGTEPQLGSPASQGRSWTGDLEVDGRRSVGGQAPVLDDSGRTIGAVLVSEEYPSWWSQLVGSAPDLLLFLGMAALLGSAGAYALSRLIRRQTRGLEPVAIASLADHQEALLRGIREGVVGVDRDGVFTVVNATATELLDLPSSSTGSAVADHALPEHVRDFLTDPADSASTVLVHQGRVLVLNRRRALDAGRFVGTVTTFVDRSDLVALESQIAAQASITETLRAQTHEFDNRLHTISGMLQLGAYDDVVGLVSDLSRQRTEISEAVTRVIRDPRVAALVIAKTSAAAEAAIELHLEPETDLPRLAPEHAADVLTVLGNLIDNALDATRGHGGEVSVRLRHREQGNVTEVRVADTGPGIDPAHLGNVFLRGWSTKPSDAVGRGVGLALVRAVCERHGGNVEAMNGDHGAVLTAVVSGAGQP
ncbi:sensor histidine kinase [Demetria terragena]|uniref:sensor histidine kinase n=1 Tax=Demetria terragena TaxID=63959 RepID=UPI00037513D8|nr:ATP-binding protein [Demetria terragena]